MFNSLRSRIYRTYLSARNISIAPSTIEDLSPRLHCLKNLILDHFPEDKNASILDFGCGHGALVYIAQKVGFVNIRGIDISIEQIDASKKLNINGVEHGDAIKTIENMSINSLDCLITYDVIEHFNRNELLNLIDTAYHILKPGGRWIIHTPNAESPFGMRMRYWDFTHELAFTRASLSQVLLSSGFSVVSCYEDRPIIHGLKSSIRFLLWNIIKLILRFYIAIETGENGKDAIYSQNFLAVAFKR